MAGGMSHCDGRMVGRYCKRCDSTTFGCLGAIANDSFVVLLVIEDQDEALGRPYDDLVSYS
jgi:hypothetical protein